MVIAQQGSSLVLRLRTPETSLSGIPSYEVEDVFTYSGWQKIDLVIEATEMRLAINGKPRLAAGLPARAFSVWADDYALALGNEMTFDRPWFGEVRRAEVRVGEYAVDYTRADSATTPVRYVIPRNRCLALSLSCSGMDPYVTLDWILNGVGFVPFGMLAAHFFDGRNRVSVAALGTLALSLTIEFGQVFLPSRFPSIEDVFFNVAGGAFGAVLAVLLFRLARAT
jgi:hypothetical protein